MSLPPTIEWVQDRVRILDQSRLPEAVAFVDCHDCSSVAEAIRQLKIRGAPAIGIAGAMGLALAARAAPPEDYEQFVREFEAACETLVATRPTAINLRWAVDRMRRVVYGSEDREIGGIQAALVREALAIWREDIEMNHQIGRWGSRLIPDGGQILTHCNAGALATGGYGTALGVLRAAHHQGKRIRVFVDETRPVLQGARLTAWELLQDAIPVTLITDNMAGVFMKKGLIHACIVGADRITANGDVANKIGTYSLSVLARHHGIPFYVAAPTSSIDFGLDNGDKIPIEERSPEEVTRIMGRLQIAPDGIEVANPAFDVTPAAHVSAIITEKGVFAPS